jgi:hypothetical protein
MHRELQASNTRIDRLFGDSLYEIAFDRTGDILHRGSALIEQARSAPLLHTRVCEVHEALAPLRRCHPKFDIDLPQVPPVSTTLSNAPYRARLY